MIIKLPRLFCRGSRFFFWRKRRKRTDSRGRLSLQQKEKRRKGDAKVVSCAPTPRQRGFLKKAPLETEKYERKRQRNSSAVFVIFLRRILRRSRRRCPRRPRGLQAHQVTALRPLCRYSTDRETLRPR